MVSFSDILGDMLIFLKLSVFGAYYYTEMILRSFIIPKRLLYKNIKGNVVLITGAAGGIGKCLVREFLNQECYVLCVDMDRSGLMRLEQELEDDESKNRLYLFETDLTSMAQITDMFSRVQFTVTHKIGRPAVDILINNAGTMNKCKSLLELTDTEVSNIFELNVLAPIRLCQLFLPDMVQRNRGHIVNMASSLAVYGTYGAVDYCATKFALFGFTEALRVELKTANRDNQVRVTLVCPFHVKTPLFGAFELPAFKWLNTSVTPQWVANDLLSGLLLDKELIGCPNYTFYIFSAIKFILPTKLNDYMQILIGFDKAVEKYRQGRKN